MLQSYHQNSQAVLAATGMNRLKLQWMTLAINAISVSKGNENNIEQACVYIIVHPRMES